VDEMLLELCCRDVDPGRRERLVRRLSEMASSPDREDIPTEFAATAPKVAPEITAQKTTVFLWK
jgi:hypothetical protein